MKHYYQIEGFVDKVTDVQKNWALTKLIPWACGVGFDIKKVAERLVKEHGWVALDDDQAKDWLRVAGQALKFRAILEKDVDALAAKVPMLTEKSTWEDIYYHFDQTDSGYKMAIPEGEDRWKFHDSMGDIVDAKLQKEHDAAIAKGTYVGCYFRESVADGNATYRITKVNAKTCGYMWVPTYDDNWVERHLGWSGNYDKEYIINRVIYRTKLNALFGKNVLGTNLKKAEA